MKITVIRDHETIFAEQDRRGMGSESDVNVYLNGSLIYAYAWPKFKTKDELIDVAFKRVADWKKKSKA